MVGTTSLLAAYSILWKRDLMSDCVIKLGHPKGTPAKWVNPDIPEHVVCNYHKDQYETIYDDSYDIKWKSILPEQINLQETLTLLRELDVRAGKAEKALEEALAYIRGCPIHGTAACPEEYMLNEDGSLRVGYLGQWQEAYSLRTTTT